MSVSFSVDAWVDDIINNVYRAIQDGKIGAETALNLLGEAYYAGDPYTSLDILKDYLPDYLKGTPGFVIDEGAWFDALDKGINKLIDMLKQNNLLPSDFKRYVDADYVIEQIEILAPSDPRKAFETLEEIIGLVADGYFSTDDISFFLKNDGILKPYQVLNPETDLEELRKEALKLLDKLSEELKRAGVIPATAQTYVDLRDVVNKLLDDVSEGRLSVKEALEILDDIVNAYFMSEVKLRLKHQYEYVGNDEYGLPLIVLKEGYLEDYQDKLEKMKEFVMEVREKLNA